MLNKIIEKSIVNVPKITSVIVGGFLLIPIFVIIIISFSGSRYLEFPPPSFTLKWYQYIFQDTSWLVSFSNSLFIASVTSFISVFLGLLASIGFVRISNLWKKVFFIFFISPLIIPVIIIAVSTYFFYSKLDLIETFTGLILAHTIITLPISFFLIVNSLSSIDSRLEYTARVLGEKPFSSFARITLPLLKPALIISYLLSFIISFDEPVIAIFIAGTKTVTLPKKLWDGIQYEINPSSASVSVILIIIVVFIIFITQKYRKYERN